MTSINRFSKRLMLAGLVAAMLGGCAVYEPIPGGYYVTNADGSRTYTPAAYTCPVGYTCSYPAPQTYPAYAPGYYAYPPAYVGPSPYFWPPLFFGVGYYGGYHHGHRR